MIYLYSGTPGSGKSLHAANDIYFRLRAKKPVIANFDINLTKIGSPRQLGEFYYLENEILSPRLLIEYSKIYFKSHRFREGAIWVFIDECQLLFNSRDWQQANRKEWLQFFSQHRKYGYDVFLICQFDRMIDRQFRSLIEYECIHRKVKNFGKFGFVLNAFAGGNLYCAVESWYPLKQRINSTFFKGRKKYFDIYNTYSTFEG